MSNGRGVQAGMFPVRAERMAAACRKLAADLRREHAMGEGPIQARGSGGQVAHRISREVAAISMDAQADRWEAEARTGVRNTTDRAKIGIP